MLKQTRSPGRRRRTVIALVLLFAGSGFSCGKKKIDRPDPGFHYRRGVELLHQQRPDLALAELKKAAAVDPTSVIILYSMGLAYLGTENLEAARDAFARVLEADPYFTDARNNLGIIYSELGAKDRALREFERVLADKRYLTPEVAQFNIGALLCDQERYQDAIAYLDAAVMRKPENAGWRLQRGQALSKLGQYELAEADFQKAIELSPALVEALYFLGEAQIHLKNVTAASESLNRAIRMAPGSPTAKSARELLKTLPSGQSPAGR